MRDRVLVQTSRGMTEYVSVESRQIERYIRCSVDILGGSVELGLQHNGVPGDPSGDRAHVRKMVASWCAATERGGVSFEARADQLIVDLESIFSVHWPDRAWFVEIWNEREALSQVYQPYGMPRST